MHSANYALLTKRYTMVLHGRLLPDICKPEERKDAPHAMFSFLTVVFSECKPVLASCVSLIAEVEQTFAFTQVSTPEIARPERRDAHFHCLLPLSRHLILEFLSLAFEHGYLPAPYLPFLRHLHT